MNVYFGLDFDEIRPIATALPGWPGGLPSVSLSPPGFSGKRYHLYFELFRVFVSSLKCCSDFTCPAEDEIGNVCFTS